MVIFSLKVVLLPEMYTFIEARSSRMREPIALALLYIIIKTEGIADSVGEI